VRVVVPALLAITITLFACSPLDLIKGVAGGSGPSLEVDTTIGDKEESVVGRVGDTSEIAAESITGGINTTNIQDIPPWVLLLLIVGWVLPSPTSMYKEIKSWYGGKGR
jgi:hypothetical protein